MTVLFVIVVMIFLATFLQIVFFGLITYCIMAFEKYRRVV